VFLPLCQGPAKAAKPRGRVQGSARRCTLGMVQPGLQADVRHSMVVAVELLGSLSPGQCSAGAGILGKMGGVAGAGRPRACSARELGWGGPRSVGLHQIQVLFPMPLA
jgi:hypothetical protein